MQKKLNWFAALLLICSISACSNQIFVKQKANFQGVLLQQNFNTMPMSDRPNSKGAPFASSLLIYKPTNIQQLDSLTGHFCSRINGEFVTTIQSDDKGQFQAYLQPGVYSIFIRYENAFYIPYFSGANGTAFFEVKQNAPTQLEIILRGNSNIE
jgi:hypothetical protein